MPKLLEFLGFDPTEGLDLSEEQKTKWAEAMTKADTSFNTKLGKDFITKDKFNEANTKAENFETQFNDVSSKLEELKKTAKTPEEFNAAIDKMKKEHDDNVESLKTESRNNLKKSKIREKLSGEKMIDGGVDLLIDKIDVDKIKMEEDGSLTGFDDVVKGLKENYKSVFLKTKVSGDDPNPNDDGTKPEGFISEEAYSKMSADDRAAKHDLIVESSKHWS